MDCRSVDQLMDEGRAPLEVVALARKHLSLCPRCQALLYFLLAPGPLPPGVDLRSSKILDLLTRDLKPVAILPRARYFVLGFVGAGAAVAACVCLIRGIASPELALHKARLVLTIYSSALLVILAVSISRLTRPAAPPPLAPRTLVFNAMFGYPVLALLLYWLDSSPSSIEKGAACLCFGLITSALAAAVFWRLIQRGYAFNLVMLGTVLGGVSGAVGTLASEWFCCPDNDKVHFVFWHGMIGLLSTLAGMAAGYLAQRRR